MANVTPKHHTMAIWKIPLKLSKRMDAATDPQPKKTRIAVPIN
jgi:hypothetical protein